MHNLLSKIKDKYNQRIIAIILISLILDYLWINSYDIIPAWDQGYHLSNLYQYANLLQNINLLNREWFDSFWTITSTYRGPLTYIISAIFINIFGVTLENSILSNFLFNTILILSIYEISRKYCKREVGLWAIYFYTFNPFIFNLRNDYLIDISQTSLIILNWLFLCKWYFNEEYKYKSVCLSGVLLGLLFLTKPTSIVFFILPISLIYFKKISWSNLLRFQLNLELFIYPISFLIVIYQWVSRNWLTIITSTINSFSWGIKYQDGLEANTIEGWIYYPLEIIKIINPVLISILIFLFLINIYKKNINFSNISNLKNLIPKNFIWWISLPLNIFLINILMSSKDPRFILPIIPIIYILIGKIIVSLKNKFYISKISKKLLILIIIILLLNHQLKIYNLKFNGIELVELQANKIHKQIIKKVNEESPFTENIIGFVPDTKEFNAFNLDAEAIRDNRGIRVSQLMSNERTFKGELKRYDWFIIKTGDQGVMTNEAKYKVSNLLLESSSFKILKEWELVDNSKLLLLKRKNLSNQLEFQDCESDNTEIKLLNLPKGFQLIINGKINDLNNKNIIINIENSDKDNSLYFALPPIKNIKDQNRCILLKNTLDSATTFEPNENPLDVNTFIFDKTNIIKKNLEYTNYRINNNDQNILKINKIEKVKLMGRYLKSGEFDRLFEVAGSLNQSDPNQKYLKDAEIIFKKSSSIYPYRIDDYYALLISQILQKDAKEAIDTIEEISIIDNANPNLYLAKSIVETYLFDLKNARISLDKAKSINKNTKNDQIINTANKILNLFIFKLF